MFAQKQETLIRDFLKTCLIGDKSFEQNRDGVLVLMSDVLGPKYESKQNATCQTI